MDKSPYSMAKFGLESSLHSKPKGCWSYLKYFFLFTSLIQSLIILGLVLFMVYGNPQISNETHLKEMDRSSRDMQQQVMHLRADRANMSRRLNATGREADQYRLLHQMALRDMRTLNQTNAALRRENMQHLTLTMNCRIAINTAMKCEQQTKELNLTCNTEKLQLKEENHRLEMKMHAEMYNCTTSKETLKRLADSAVADRERFHKEMIALREDKRALSDQLDRFKASCSAIENQFQVELRQLENNVQAALQKVLPNQGSSPFQLGTVPGQQFPQLGQDCKLLSADITNLMRTSVTGLNSHVSSVMAENSLLKAQQVQEKNQLDECQRAKESLALDMKRTQERQQAICDSEVTFILKEKESLKREKEELGKRLGETGQALQVAQAQLNVKIKEVERCVKTPFNTGTGMRPGGGVNLIDLNEQINRILGDKTKTSGTY